MNPLARALVPSTLLLSGCLTPAPLPPSPDASVDASPPPLRLLAVTTATGDLDAVGRRPTLALRFDRPVAPPGPDEVALFDLAPSASLSADLGRGVISAAHAAHRVDARVEPGDDAATLTVQCLATQLPDASLTLAVSMHLRALDGGELGEGVDAARLVPLRVAPVSRCGPLATVLTDGVAGRGPLALRFDRPVRARDATARFTLDARPVEVALTLDCLDGRGGARCAWARPVDPLREGGALRWRASTMVGDDGLATELAPDALTARPRPAASPRFGAAVPCARDESPAATACIRRRGETLTLRVATTEAALLRASTRAGVADVRADVSGPATLHTLRLTDLPAGAEFEVSLDAMTLDGAVNDTLRLPLLGTPPRVPRVRIGEVLARPRGAGAQEFVELVNDDDVAVSLRGWALASDTGRSPLPDTAAIAARGRALLVGEAFDPRGSERSGDPAAAPGAAVIVVRGALAGRGLRDSGAPWSLSTPDGVVASAVPGDAPGRAPREGVSLVRATTSLPDEDPAAWAYDAREGSTPGAPDRLRGATE